MQDMPQNTDNSANNMKFIQCQYPWFFLLKLKKRDVKQCKVYSYALLRICDMLLHATLIIIRDF
jgi:hypothetical protein